MANSARIAARDTSSPFASLSIFYSRKLYHARFSSLLAPTTLDKRISSRRFVAKLARPPEAKIGPPPTYCQMISHKRYRRKPQHCECCTQVTPCDGSLLRDCQRRPMKTAYDQSSFDIVLSDPPQLQSRSNSVV